MNSSLLALGLLYAPMKKVVIKQYIGSTFLKISSSLIILRIFFLLKKTRHFAFQGKSK